MLTKKDLDLIEQRVAEPLKVEIQKVEKRLSKQIKSIKKDTRYMANFLDRDQLKVAKRVKIIEKHLGLPTPQPV